MEAGEPAEGDLKDEEEEEWGAEFRVIFDVAKTVEEFVKGVPGGGFAGRGGRRME